MHRGYIKIWRKFADNPRFNDPQYLAVWIWLLLLATHKPIEKVFKGKTITLQPGQLITGRTFLSQKTGVNRSKIERILQTMKIEHQIEQQTSNKNRLISICNWKLYQQNEHQFEQQVSNNRATSEQQVSTYKNDKNDKNDKNKKNIYIYADFEYMKKEAFKETYEEFLKMRKLKKKPATEKAEKIILKKLHGYNINVAIAMLEKSILNTWTDVYELKPEERNAINQRTPENDEPYERWLRDEAEREAKEAKRRAGN